MVNTSSYNCQWELKYLPARVCSSYLDLNVTPSPLSLFLGLLLAPLGVVSVSCCVSSSSKLSLCSVMSGWDQSKCWVTWYAAYTLHWSTFNVWMFSDTSFYIKKGQVRCAGKMPLKNCLVTSSCAKCLGIAKIKALLSIFHGYKYTVIITLSVNLASLKYFTPACVSAVFMSLENEWMVFGKTEFGCSGKWGCLALFFPGWLSIKQV